MLSSKKLLASSSSLLKGIPCSFVPSPSQALFRQIEAVSSQRKKLERLLLEAPISAFDDKCLALGSRSLVNTKSKSPIADKLVSVSLHTRFTTHSTLIQFCTNVVEGGLTLPEFLVNALCDKKVHLSTRELLDVLPLTVSQDLLEREFIDEICTRSWDEFGPKEFSLVFHAYSLSSIPNTNKEEFVHKFQVELVKQDLSQFAINELEMYLQHVPYTSPQYFESVWKEIVKRSPPIDNSGSEEEEEDEDDEEEEEEEDDEEHSEENEEQVEDHKKEELQTLLDKTNKRRRRRNLHISK